MSQAVQDAIRARQEAKAPEPVEAPKKRRRKPDPVVEDVEPEEFVADVEE